VLGPDNQRRLDDIERGLERDDPGFVARMGRPHRRRRRLPAIVGLLTLLLILLIVGIWLGSR
jgi:hypothetical protein